MPCTPVDDLTTDLTDVGVESGKLAKAVREFGGYLAANACAIPNYGERRRAGEAISYPAAWTRLRRAGAGRSTVWDGFGRGDELMLLASTLVIC